MFSKKGEISTIVILGTLIVVTVAGLLSSTVTNKRNITNTQAAGGSCRNNPEAPPDGGYTWVANCASSCVTNTDCPQNTTDSNGVNPSTSNWCYGFAEGAKCLQLQKGSGTNPTPAVGTQTGNPTTQPNNTGSTAKCDKAIGCGGACNGLFNHGCGYGGCREWEICMNNTCIDTTNLGTQSASPDACHENATTGGPQNIAPTSGSTVAPTNNQNNNTNTPVPTKGSGNTTKATPTTSPNTTDGRCTYTGDIDCITLTPKATVTKTPLPNGTSCTAGTQCQNGCCSQGFCNSASVCQTSCTRPGQMKCPGTNTCVDSQGECAGLVNPTPTKTNIFIPFIGSSNNTPTPTSTRVQVTLGTPNQNPLKTTPTPTKKPVVYTTDKEVIMKSCYQNGGLSSAWGCFYE